MKTRAAQTFNFYAMPSASTATSQISFNPRAEGTLAKLLREGVFLTVDELKGRRAIVRGNTTSAVGADSFANPLFRAQFYGKSGGSRGGGTNVPIGLDAIRSVSLNRHLALYARGGLHWPHATWSVPGGATITLLLRCAAMGAPISRWFSQVNPRSAGLHARAISGAHR